jgi:hypothetical protein
MARAEEILTQDIINLLAEEPRGLEVNEIIERIGAGDGIISPRGVRNLLTKLEKEGKVVKRKRWGKKPGAPPQAYFHPNHVPRQLDFLEELLGVKSQIIPKSEIERESIEDPVELNSLQGAHNVLENMNRPPSTVLETIAASHVEQHNYAQAIITVAPKLAEENPIDLLLRMADWTVNNLNRLADQIRAMDCQDKHFNEKVGELEMRITRTRNYFHRFWRLDYPIDGKSGPSILEIPPRAKHFVNEGHRARFNEEKARQHLQHRVRGNRVIETSTVRADLYRAAAGSDASVADIYLEHAQGSFIPPDPVVVTTAAAALKAREKNGQADYDYQDFDIFPDQLRAYADHMAAERGLVISPALRQLLPEEDFKHTRMAAMELRQYTEDLQIVTGGAGWRPFGGSPLLGVVPKPRIIFRDGRVFPLVHRIKDFEDDGLYGRIVRNQIEKFKQVFHNTVLGSDVDIVYASAVKNPELSWLAPLVFWYLYTEQIQVKGKVAVNSEDRVYRPPFADTAVSHLLFLGLAKHLGDFAQDKLFISCRALRRFSDIAIDDDAMIPVHDEREALSGSSLMKRVDDNEKEDWEEYIRQRIDLKRRQSRFAGSSLDLDDYRNFIYLCTNTGVSMCYTATTTAYAQLVSETSEGGHFLIPRLEVAIDMKNPRQEEKALFGMLSWLASGGWDLDNHHTQSGFDTGEREDQLPILVPDVTLLAHETVTFARDKLGEEVQDEIRRLIVELRKRFEKGY